nr:hypothetical protein Iba_chr08fCG1350 [Ipomoea batatas]
MASNRRRKGCWMNGIKAALMSAFGLIEERRLFGRMNPLARQSREIRRKETRRRFIGGRHSEEEVAAVRLLLEGRALAWSYEKKNTFYESYGINIIFIAAERKIYTAEKFIDLRQR